MRGANIGLLLLGAILVSSLLECVFTNVPSFDVPYCSSPSSCARLTNSKDPVYAKIVGETWYRVNELRESIDNVYSICSLDLNWLKLQKLVSSAVSGAGVRAYKVTQAADAANTHVVHRLVALHDYYTAAGVSCLPDSEIHGVYQEIDRVLRDYSTVPKHPLAAKLRAVTNFQENVGRKLGLVSIPFLSFVAPAVSATLRLHPITMILSKVGSVAMEAFQRPIVEDYVNASVGRTDSVYSHFLPLLNSLLLAEEKLNERAKRDVERVERLQQEILEDIEVLRKASLEKLNPEMVSRFRRTVAPTVVQGDIRSLATAAEVKLLGEIRAFRENMNRFRSRDANFLCALARAEERIERLENLKEELDRDIDQLDEFVNDCKIYLQNYPMSGAYERRRKALLRDFTTLSDCSNALSLVEEYEKYGRMEEALRACEEEAGIYPDYNCVGNVLERYACCKNFLDLKVQQLYETNLYREFLELYSTVLETVEDLGDAEDVREFYSIDPYPRTPSALEEEYKKLLSLYKHLLQVAKKEISPSIEYEGYVDTMELAELNVCISFPYPLQELIEVPIPFKVAAVDMIGGDLQFLGQKEEKLIFRNGRTACLRVIAYPTEVDQEVLGSDWGGRFVRIKHNRTFPLRHRYVGNVRSFVGPVHWDSTFLYFDGSGEVLLYERPIDIELEGEENDVSGVILTNLSQESFSGDVFVPVEGNGPAYCTAVDGGMVCRVNLDPLERRIIRVKGRETEVSMALEPVQLLPQEKIDVKLSEENYLPEILSEANILLTWIGRAEELGVLLPIDQQTIETMVSLARDGDATVQRLVHSFLTYKKERIRRGIERTIAFAEQDPDMAGVASRARELLESDPILAYSLVLSAPVRETEQQWPAILGLVIVIVGAVLAYRNLKIEKRKKKRRIPRL